MLLPRIAKNAQGYWITNKMFCWQMFKVSAIFLCQPLLFVPCWLALSDVLQRLKLEVIRASTTFMDISESIGRWHTQLHVQKCCSFRGNDTSAAQCGSSFLKGFKSPTNTTWMDTNALFKHYAPLNNTTTAHALHIVTVTFYTPNAIS